MEEQIKLKKIIGHFGEKNLNKIVKQWSTIGKIIKDGTKQILTKWD